MKFFGRDGSEKKQKKKLLASAAGLVRRRKKTCIAAVLLLAVIGLLGSRAYSRYRMAKVMASAMGEITTVQVTRQDLIDSISVTGTIASADSRDVSATASNVEVQQVNYEVGDYVNAGDTIVVLDSSDLELRLEQAQNSQALSEYNENKSIETASESYTEAVEDGTSDYSRAVKNEADAKETLQEASADASEAADALKRQEERVAEAKAAYEADPTDANKQAWDAAQTEYTSRHQAYTAAAEAEEQAQEAYETASENLADAQKQNDRNISSAADSLEKAQMEQQYSNDSSDQTIENYQEQIAACTVTAPISGVITAMNVEEGDTYLGEGNTLFTVADEKNFVVSASVDEYDISSISEGMTGAVIVEALGDDELPATVSFVSPTVSNTSMGSSTYSIEIALDDENTDLRIGMTAKASIILDAAYDVLTVPYDCVNTDEDGNSYVYVDQNGEKVQTPVTVGMQGDYYVEVSGDGLDETSLVYYSTPMSTGAESGGSDDAAESGFSFDMGGGGGAPSGGGPGGF
ncbi:MAG: efflux RND transporter periplasmic adaptor subunit [Eubacteriales bacterium]|nr:efflux RND transporter periplasmic adaptor subunit [Eubacteriales bacterium]